MRNGSSILAVCSLPCWYKVPAMCCSRGQTHPDPQGRCYLLVQNVPPMRSKRSVKWNEKLILISNCIFSFPSSLLFFLLFLFPPLVCTTPCFTSREWTSEDLLSSAAKSKFRCYSSCTAHRNIFLTRVFSCRKLQFEFSIHLPIRSKVSQ